MACLGFLKLWTPENMLASALGRHSGASLWRSTTTARTFIWKCSHGRTSRFCWLLCDAARTLLSWPMCWYRRRDDRPQGQKSRQLEIWKPEQAGRPHTLALSGGQTSLPQFCSAVSALQKKADERELREVFAYLSTRGSGQAFGHKLLERKVRDLGEKFSDWILRDMIDNADVDGDGLVGPEDFRLIFQKPAT
mmetsp:Transcript_77863/g.178218  ORF Transcript_77863/g.178218 Transcript_77863/m.178218 type:complete len:193 (+) Transcript_77863:252-830(+)